MAPAQDPNSVGDAAKRDEATTKVPSKDPKKKDDKKEEDLSEEDLQLKQNLELYVERVQDPNPELQKAALESMRQEIRASTSSMTSVPKPLKFLRPHYGALKEFHVKMAESDLKKMLADILSVLAMTMSVEGERESLNYRLTGSEGDIGSWGHEYVRNLAGEIAEEYIMCQDEEEEIEAIQPLRMYFPPTEYKKKKKISTRCYINQVMKAFKGLKHRLTTREKKWFEEHPQFKHIFHMPTDDNHKVMGIWLLLLRIACIERKKEAWFVVNGVPIRYGIKEHALISRLNCKNYPLGYKEKGSLRFVRKYITRPVIRLQDVKEALEDMVPRKGNDDRLKMLVLYFLASVIRGQTKCGQDATGVEEVLLRAVEDLTYCETFPWGRLSFDHMLMEIDHTMRHFGGKVKKGGPWPIPGFCIPLELLAFEAIPQLNSSFREVNPEADSSCPRMCKLKFRKSYLKGFPLSEINEQLGTTKDIVSIIPAREEEHDLMSEIIEEEDVDDVHDVIVNSWMGRLSRGKTVFFEEMYNEDADSRVEEEIEEAENQAMGEMGGLVDLVNEMRGEMDERFNTIEEKIAGLEERITPLEAYVKNEHARQGNLMDETNEDSVLNAPQPRDDNPETNQKSDEENLGVFVSKKKSEIKAGKRSREPGSYPRKPVTRSTKPRVV